MDAFTGIASLSLLIITVPLGLIVLALAVIFNSRRDPDDSGMRTTAVYFGAVNFISLLALLFAVTATVGSLSSLIVDEDERGDASSSFSPDDLSTDFGFEPDLSEEFGEDFGEVFEEPSDDPNDAAWRGAIQGALAAAAAALIFVFHWRRREEFVGEPGFDASAAWRVDRVYLYLMCFVTAVIGTVAAVRFDYDIFRLIIPGVTATVDDDSTERQKALADLLTMGTLFVGSAYIFFWHWRLVAGETELWKRLSRSRTSSDEPEAQSPPPTAGV